MSIRPDAGALVVTLASALAFGLVDGCSARSANAVSRTAIRRTSFTRFLLRTILEFPESVLCLAPCVYELQLFLLRDARLETTPAARLVYPGRAHYDQFLGPAQALRVLGRIPAAHADGQRLGDGFGQRQQIWHRRERAAHIVRIHAGDHH